MLRHYEQHGGGVKVYTENLLRELLALDTPHEFVLIYRNPRLIGTYPDGNNVREIAAGSPSIFTWDQLAMRKVEKTEKLDLIFNPKYSVPLTAKCSTVFVCHGLDWYVMPKWSKWIDRISHRYLIPRYARKADAIIAVSNTARQHLTEYLGIPENLVHTIYLGVDEAFGKPIPPDRLKKIRSRYGLPERFFLYVGQIYPPKNFGRLLRAYANVGPELGISLVVAGEHRWLSGDELALIDRLGISNWVVRPGWIDRDTLPAFYSLAEALLLPSLYEACPSPPVEAMSSGCPVVTSDRHGTLEIADKAAFLVNPEDIESIANGMYQIVTDYDLRRALIEAGRKRALFFSWKKCAQQTLNVLERILEQVQ
jgi:glycosyltransferase involved in cell wall biosynthesis